MTALEDIYVQLNVGGDLVEALDYTVDYRAAGNRLWPPGGTPSFPAGAGSAYPVGTGPPRHPPRTPAATG